MANHYLRAFSKPTFLLGVNYWSRAGGPRMWEAERFDRSIVRAEIAKFSELGLGALRAFAFLPTMMPHPPRVEPDPLNRMRELLELCAQRQIAVLPSLLVGHMSGENYDFPGQAGRSPYTDPEVLSWQLNLAEAMAKRLADCSALSAWVLSNEMPLWGGRGSVLDVTAWAHALAAKLRQHGAGIPIGTGDGYMNASGGQNGFEPQLLAQVVDYLGPHAYYGDDDALRQSLYYEYLIRSLQHLGKPVVFEEFGCSSCQAGEAEQAALWREIIHTCMSTGAAGALGWCSTDFALANEPPYSHHAFELGFGILRADGSEKPVCEDLRQASAWVRKIPWDAVDAPRPRAALVRPSYTETTYPFSWEERRRMVRSLLQAYTMARKAGLECEVLPESHSFEGFDLIMVPSTQKLLAPTWERLAERAQAGATIYWSYFGGDYTFHQGMWCHVFERLTGCKHRLRYGVPDLPAANVSLEGESMSLSFATDGSGPFSRSLLPIQPVGAQVLLHDGARRPALVRNALGKGTVYFLVYPIEYYLAGQPDINRSDTSQALYTFLAKAARIDRRHVSSDGRVQTHRLALGKGELVWAINRSWDELETTIDAPGASGRYGPKEVRVIRID